MHDSCRETAIDFAEMAKTIDHASVAIAGEKASAATLNSQMKLVAMDVSVSVLKNTGHWLMEERPVETMHALIKFL